MSGSKPAVRIKNRHSERLEVVVDLPDRTIVIGKYRNSVEAGRRYSAIKQIIDAAFEAGRREQAGRRCATCRHRVRLPNEEPCKTCTTTDNYDGWEPLLAGGAK